MMKKTIVSIIMVIVMFSLLLSSCNTHTHSFNVISKDDINHYLECECGEPNIEAHQYTAEVIKEPTCKIEGKQKLTCTICSYSKTEPIEKIEHTIERTEAVEPTCINIGYTEGERCTVCHTKVKKAEKLDRLPHNFVNDVCTSCGSRKGSDGLVYTEYLGGVNEVCVIYEGGELEEIVVPSYNEDGKKVVVVGYFNGGETLKKVILPDTIEKIGNWSFENCYSLEEIFLPDSVTTIEIGAFKNCRSLTKINIPEKVKKISESTFENCYSLESVEINQVRQQLLTDIARALW